MVVEQRDNAPAHVAAGDFGGLGPQVGVWSGYVFMSDPA
jgi:hypothetical protein